MTLDAEEVARLKSLKLSILFRNHDYVVVDKVLQSAMLTWVSKLPDNAVCLLGSSLSTCASTVTSM